MRRTGLRSLPGTLLLLLAALAVRQPALAADPARGRALFQDGADGAGFMLEGRVQVGGGEAATLRGRAAACASCHGEDAAGRVEGGVAAPALEGPVLRRPRRGERGPYDADTLRRALAGGGAPDGAMLNRAMPRYDLQAGAVDDLLAWLDRAADEPAPGVAPDRIVLALPFLDEPGFRAAAEQARAVLAAALAGSFHGRAVLVLPHAFPAGATPMRDCGPSALAAVAGIGLGRDAAAAAAASRCFPLRLLPLSDPVEGDLGAMQTGLPHLAAALAREAAARPGGAAVLAGTRPDLAAAGRAASAVLAGAVLPCAVGRGEAGLPLGTRNLVLLCPPDELRELVAGAAGRTLYVPLDLAGQARLRVDPDAGLELILGDPRGRPAEIAAGRTTEVERVALAAGEYLAEALRRAGRAATRDALRRAVRDLPPLPGLLPAKDCGPPAEEPRGLQLLASGADGVRPVRAFACAPD